MQINSNAINDIIDIRGKVSCLDWRFAKTMPHCPHWYIVRNEVIEDIYVALFNAIEQYGVIEYFYKTPRKYLYLGDGFKYWHMCGDANCEINTKWSLNDSRVINRCMETDRYI